MKFRLLVLVGFLAFAAGSSKAQNTSDINDEQLEKQLSQWVGKQTWVDPVTTVPKGCEYVLYPTIQRGKGTQGSFILYLPPDYKNSTDP